jgi:hypothetical protein
MTRRDFLGESGGAVAGIAFISCGLMGGGGPTSVTGAQAQARRRDTPTARSPRRWP